MGLARFFGRRRDKTDDKGKSDSEKGMDTARRTSSLPSGVFKAMNPGVEAELADGVAEVFLRHMMTDERQKPASGIRKPPPTRPGNDVAPAEIVAFIDDLKVRALIEPPSLMANLATERLWILSDLAAKGMPDVREQAQAELAAFVREASADDAMATEFLRDVTRQLQFAESDGDFDALTSLLQSATDDGTETTS